MEETNIEMALNCLALEYTAEGVYPTVCFVGENTVQASDPFNAVGVVVAVEEDDAVSWVLRSLSHFLIIGLFLYFIVGFIYGFLVTWRFLGQNPDADFQDVLGHLGVRPGTSTEVSNEVSEDVGTGVVSEMRADAGSDLNAANGAELVVDVSVDKNSDVTPGQPLSKETSQVFPEEALLG